MNYYNNQTYYDILGVSKDASISAIQNAVERLKYGAPDDRVPFSMWDKIDEAYSVLSNPDRRFEYDKKLNTNTNYSLVQDDIVEGKNLEESFLQVKEFNDDKNLSSEEILNNSFEVVNKNNALEQKPQDEFAISDNDYFRKDEQGEWYKVIEKGEKIPFEVLEYAKKNLPTNPIKKQNEDITPQEESYVISDSDYFRKDENDEWLRVIEKGDRITKLELENAKKNYSTYPVIKKVKKQVVEETDKEDITPQEESYVISDSDYFRKDENDEWLRVIEKGDRITKLELENAKKNYSTYPVVKEVKEQFIEATPKENITPQEEDYVISDNDYFRKDENGEWLKVIKKGESIPSETLKYAKEHLNVNIDLTNESEAIGGYNNSNINDDEYIIPYNSDEDKERIVSKYVLTTGRFGMLKTVNWEIFRYKLQQDNKPKKINKIFDQDSEFLEEYYKNLDKEIDKYLSEPHNEYKLELSRIKYENQVKLLEKIFEMRKLEYNKNSSFKNKLNLIAIKSQLISAYSRLKSIIESIENYDLKSHNSELGKINSKLIDANKNLQSQNLTDKEREKLKIKVNNLLSKRNNKASKMKIKLVRSWNIDDKFLYAKDFVGTLMYTMDTKDDINEMLNYKLR